MKANSPGLGAVLHALLVAVMQSPTACMLAAAAATPTSEVIATGLGPGQTGRTRSAKEWAAQVAVFGEALHDYFEQERKADEERARWFR